MVEGKSHLHTAALLLRMSSAVRGWKGREAGEYGRNRRAETVENGNYGWPEWRGKHQSED
jgi:hypothetical protein